MLGHVRTPDGSPLPGAALTLIDTNGNQTDHVRSAADGSYRLKTPAAGSYVLVCVAPPHQPVAERLTIRPETTRHDLVLGLPATAGLSAGAD
ncbi:MAG: carboxypeptidase-like regulatory domain-containing protein [Pseudonocardiaceae bacterium]